MSERRTIPAVLQRLALIWAVLGTLAICGMSFNVDLGWGPWPITLLGLVFAPGLVAGTPLVRKLLLVFTWLGMVFAVLLLFGGLGLEGSGRYIVVGAAVVIMLILLEQRWVLNRSDVRRYFDPYGYVP